MEAPDLTTADRIRLLPAHNRELVRPGDGLPEDGFYMLAPFGEFPVTVRTADGRELEVIQVVTPSAASNLVAAFNAARARNPSFEILIDREHRSETDDGDTDAMGWIDALEVRDDGLYSRNRWTPEGERLVRDRIIRFISPSWGLERGATNRRRPAVLFSAGLTNKHNLSTLKPLMNRAATQPQPHEEMTMKDELIALLGLKPEGAEPLSDEAVLEAARNRLAANKQTAADLETAKNRAATLEAENTTLLEELADRDLEALGDQVQNRDSLRKALVSNRAATLDILRGLKPRDKKPVYQPVHNRSGAKTPDVDALKDEPGRSAERRKLVNTIRTEQGVSFDVAWNRARALQPSLFD